MSSDMKATPEPVRIDYMTPIARSGEQQFACILRNRSGFDAGNIDFGLRHLGDLPASEQQDVCDIAYALYRAVCDQTRNVAAQDTAALTAAEARGAARERERLSEDHDMANGCLNMIREQLVALGIDMDKTPPMFYPEAICAAVQKYADPAKLVPPPTPEAP
jgi:hypothetical protein